VAEAAQNSTSLEEKMAEAAQHNGILEEEKERLKRKAVRKCVCVRMYVCMCVHIYGCVCVFVFVFVFVFQICACVDLCGTVLEYVHGRLNRTLLLIQLFSLYRWPF
jgi:hypothetical protein